jgi:hypothetical protein
MKMNFHHQPLNTLPSDMDTILFLIRSDLKSERLFGELKNIGLEESFYQSWMGELVFSLMHLGDSDEIMQVYCKLIAHRSRKIDGTEESVVKQAVKVYAELLSEKKRLRESRSPSGIYSRAANV